MLLVVELCTKATQRMEQRKESYKKNKVVETDEKPPSYENRMGQGGKSIRKYVKEWWDFSSKIVRKAGEEIFGKTLCKGVPQNKESW